MLTYRQAGRQAARETERGETKGERMNECINLNPFYLQRLLSSGIMAAGAQLTELDLTDKVVGQNRIEGFADLLKSRSCYRLQTLKLNNNRLGVEGGKVGHINIHN